MARGKATLERRDAWILLAVLAGGDAPKSLADVIAAAD
jgi:hypothetical protein